MKKWSSSLAAILTMVVLSACDGGASSSFPDLNVRWRRETPPKRNEYSNIIFSREFDGVWKDCLSIEDTHLNIEFQRNSTFGCPTFILSTPASHVIIGIRTSLIKEGKPARNLGLEVLERDGGVVNELKEGAMSLAY